MSFPLRPLLALILIGATTGCTAIQRPRAPRVPHGAATAVATVGVCPAAREAIGWLAASPTFGRVAPVEETPAPDLVIVAAHRAFDATLFRRPLRTSTRVTQAFSILTLGVLPTWFRHEGVAELTFARPRAGAAPCDAPEATHVVRVRPAARQLLAFWALVPALVAIAPGWVLAGGDELPAARLDPADWLPAAVHAERAALARLAAGG